MYNTGFDLSRQHFKNTKPIPVLTAEFGVVKLYVSTPTVMKNAPSPSSHFNKLS